MSAIPRRAENLPDGSPSNPFNENQGKGMKTSQAGLGRVFILRLEHGETVHQEIEKFAREKSIRAAALIILGGADRGSKLVVGPEDSGERPVTIVERLLDDMHEVSGTGTLFPDPDGNPMLHMHMALGRQDNAAVGCIRRGVKVWEIMEAVLFELVDTEASRIFDKRAGFYMMNP
jgi:predicted DNA-binding protein with PD1-like motif